MATESVTLSVRGLSCASCVSRIENALRNQEGVIWARINFAAQQAIVTFDPTVFTRNRLVTIIRGLGYDVEGSPGEEAEVSSGAGRPVMAAFWPVVAGVAGVLFLVALYLGLVTLAQGWEHATELIWGDRWLVAAVAAGFGVQVGLYVYVRRLRQVHHALGQCTALTTAGTGTSSAAMVACCAHHLTDVLPILGASAAATFLNEYRIPFMLVGLGMNLIGIAVMLRLIGRVRAAMASGSPGEPLKEQTPAQQRSP